MPPAAQRTPEHFADRFGWFGKLPGAGDFVSRRMSYPLQQFWDHWCAEGMEALKAGSPASGTAVWGDTPAWAFVLPAQPGVPAGQIGVFAPSCDRVGRVFPFVVMAPLLPREQAALLDRAGWLGQAWGEMVARAQESRLGVEAVDEGLHVALADTLARPVEEDEDDDGETTVPGGLEPDPATLPWPELNRHFDLHGPASYWWSVPAARTGFQSRKYTGPLRTTHFLDLCR